MFEGDIMLSEEDQRNGVINRAHCWRTKTVPFIIDRVFCDYCSTKLQSGLRVVEGNINVL
jgi:hypothetical protein